MELLIRPVIVRGRTAFALTVYSNEYVRLTFDKNGCVSSIREVVSERELVGMKVPFVAVTRTC